MKRTYAYISVSGMSVILLLIMLISMPGRSAQNFREIGDGSYEIYRALIVKADANQKISLLPSTPGALAEELKTHIPEVICSARYLSADWPMHVNNRDIRFSGAFADPDIFSIFEIQLQKGDAATAFSDPFSIVISEEAALECFGDYNPVGKSLMIGEMISVQVTGVFKNNNLPDQIDYVLSPAILKLMDISVDNWQLGPWNTFVLLNEKQSCQEVNLKIADLIHKNRPEFNAVPVLEPLNDVSSVQVKDNNS